MSGFDETVLRFSARADGSLIMQEGPTDGVVDCPAGLVLKVEGNASAVSFSIEKNTEAGWVTLEGPLEGSAYVGFGAPSTLINHPPMCVRIKMHSMDEGFVRFRFQNRTVADYIAKGVNPWLESPWEDETA